MIKKRIAYLTACSLLLAQMPVITMADTRSSRKVQADFEVTLNVDYPVADWENLNIKVSLLKDNKVIGTFPLDEVMGTFNKQINGYSYEVGMETEAQSLHMLFNDLPLGEYKVKLEGKGCKTYTSEAIKLEKTEKHLVIQSGTKTFGLGDVDQDGKVDELDLVQLKSALGGADLNYDLNGDKKVDIEDLSLLYWGIEEEGETLIHNTKLIPAAVVEEDKISKAIESINGGNVTVNGEISSLFDGSDETALELKVNNDLPISEENPVKLPVSFAEEVMISQISITAPADSSPSAGNIIYTTADGSEVKQSFSEVSSYVSARTKNASNVITINLGKQIPIQKLTIEVTEANRGQGLLAAISKIEFLEDVVDNAVNQELGVIKGLSGRALDEEVTLSWNQAANVTGYKVKYGTESGAYKEVRHTGTNQITIDGLENFTPYYFMVQAVNGEWEGPVSNEITLVPSPQQKPSAPTEINAGSFSEAISVSFRLGDDATSSNIYYKKASDKSYTKLQNAKSGTMIKGLENGTEYMLYATAVNDIGESLPSKVVKATPSTEEIVIPEVPTYQQIDSSHIKSIQLVDSNNVSKEFYPEGFTTQNMIDEDYRTHWTAQTYQRSRGFTVTFDQPYEMDYVAFVPRLDTDLTRYNGTRKYLEWPHEYAIKVWETADSEPKVLVSRARIPNIGQNGLKVLTFDKTKVEKIEVSLFEWNGAGNISISEVMFYEYYNLVERIDGLFANGLHTEVKPEVTLETIRALEEELNERNDTILSVDKKILRAELQSAREIIEAGSVKNSGEIVEVNQGMDKNSSGDKNFAMGSLSDLQPAGVMAYAKDEILVYVDAPEGGVMPELVCTQFYGDGEWSKSISLQPGRNIIEVPQVVNYNTTKGGPLYLRYNGKAQDETTVRIIGARTMPTLEILDLSADENSIKSQVASYIRHLTSYVADLKVMADTEEKPANNGIALTSDNKAKHPGNATEIGTDKILLSLPAEEVLEGITGGIEGDFEAQVNRLYESLMTWDANMKLHYEILGLTEDADESEHRYPSTRINIRYMPMNNGVFMYASGSHVGIQYDSGAALVRGELDSENGYFGWGINHEIGHIINDGKFVVGETTNNIFSLFAQTVNGGPSRLETSDIYSKIYEKVTSKDTGLAGNVFVNLGMFWQLHLAYDFEEEGLGEGINGFYPAVHRLSRVSDFEKLDALNYFIRIASDAVKKDLTPFFERWGLHISADTYSYVSKYDREERALYYLNDEARRYRLKDGRGMAEDARAYVEAEVVQGRNTLDTEVVLSLGTDMEEEALLGYEIYRDNELIAFTEEAVYHDKVSANNVTHTYSVVAYDKLLNTTEKASAEEVYIASEGVLDCSNYIYERTTSGGLQITLPDMPEAVGLKLMDVPEITTSSAYTVEVSADGKDWHTAKRSKLKAGTQLIYFNKPGLSEEDDRIWTYDAKYIRITGEMIGELEDSQIEVLGYPGDAVYFTENGIGYLAEDYNLNGVELAKGTLVVMGAYRGHPVYSKIVLSAHYVNEKGYDEAERPDYKQEVTVEAVSGELYLFAELPEDQEVSKVGNGIWMFVPKEQTLPAQIKANLFRTDEAETTEGGRLVSDTKWLLVPGEDSLPKIKLD